MSEKLKVAAQQALTAMEDLKTYDIRPSSVWRYFYPSATGDYVNLREFQQKAEPAINALRAALAEQTVPSDCADSHQPAAWLDQDINASYTAAEMDGESTNGLAPLYAAPPQRPPLTDEEIEHLSRTMVGGNKSVQWLARIIERKVRGEKE